MAKSRENDPKLVDATQMAFEILCLRDKLASEYRQIGKRPETVKLRSGHIADLEKKMQASAKLVFNRVSKGDRYINKPLKPLFKQLSKLQGSDKNDPVKITKALGPINAISILVAKRQ